MKLSLRSLYPKSFFSKQLYAVLTVNLVSTIVVLGILYFNSVHEYRDNLVNSLKSTSTLLASASSSSLLFEDAQSAKSLLDSTSYLSSIRYAVLYTDNFEQFANYKHKETSVDHKPEILELGANFKGEYVHFLTEVKLDQELIGYLVISSSTRDLDLKHSELLRIVFIILIVSMLISYFLNWQLQKRLSKPISKLFNLVKYISQNRSYDKRLPAYDSGELGELFGGVNSILETIEEHQVQLRQHTIHLENKVQLRTEQLFRRANYDGLTNLTNRHLLIDRLEQAICNAERQKTKLAVMFLDLDRFKVINDSLGHHVGDLVLIEAASRLIKAMRKADSVCRWGGDEFVLLIEQAGDRQQLERLAQRIIDVLSEPVRVQGQDLHISTSIGIAIYPEQIADANGLLRHADISMYKSKEFGPGNYRFFDQQMLEESILRLSVENKLRVAIEKSQFTLVYQPQINVKSAKIHGLEALIRWRDEGRPVSPSQFIPIAEDSGLINPLSFWVLNEACSQLARRKKNGINLVPIAVNIPVSFIMLPDCAEKISKIINKYSISPYLLEIEITENSFIDSNSLAENTLVKLKRLGLRISIDDFGTGYSCLSYLGTLPIDKLKIDGSFIRQLGNNAANDGIVESIIMLGKSLNLVTVAECVETEQQYSMIKEMGCDVIQGHYFSEPLVTSDAESCLGASGYKSESQ